MLLGHHGHRQRADVRFATTMAGMHQETLELSSLAVAHADSPRLRARVARMAGRRTTVSAGWSAA